MASKWVKQNNAFIVKADGHSVGVPEAREYLSDIKGFTQLYGFLIFDFSEVTEINPAALRTLTFATSLANQISAKIAVVGGDVVTKCIADCGLQKLFPCYSSMEQIVQSSSSTSRLREDILEALDDAVKTTCRTVTGSEVEPVDLGKDGYNPSFEIGAVVGLVDRYFKGSLILGFSRQTFLNLMSKMFGSNYTEITDEISDGPAEVLNMILGHVKIALSEKGFGIHPAIPTTIRGSNLQIIPSTTKESSSIVLVFKSEFGNFYVELNANFQAMEVAA